ncbi:MAG: alpha/beta fold hydrolase [Pseudomonadota bacterium]|nr:alpha/beta fold hydrolase [Pseudomonadota bacterium]
MTNRATPNLATLSLPFLWPIAVGAAMAEEGAKLYAKDVAFIGEEIKINQAPRPKLATPNTLRLDLRTMAVREYGAAQGLPTLVVAPYAGHTAMIADYAKGQSLIETLLAGGLRHVALTDWKSASADMKDLEIDNYLAELIVAIDDLGGRVNLVGLCQGGWLSAMAAARFPAKINALALAGAPVDTQAGDGPLKRMVNAAPMSFYEELVALGGGLMKGELMLRGWKNMHPEQNYLAEHIDLFEHIDDPAYLERRETFASWYENPLDLPGRWYLQAIRDLFKGNLFAAGGFVGLGRPLQLKAVECPLYLLAGESDDITTREQVFAAKALVGSKEVVETLAPGGHVGLFMGARTLKQTWPEIARWLARRS